MPASVYAVRPTNKACTCSSFQIERTDGIAMTCCLLHILPPLVPPCLCGRKAWHLNGMQILNTFLPYLDYVLGSNNHLHSEFPKY